MQERVPQPEGYVFSTALRYEFPLLLSLSSKKFLDWPRKRIREWMQEHAFFSDLQETAFSTHPYHYCALVSDCEDDYKSVAKRYENLSKVPLRDLSDEQVRVFKLRVPEDFHVTKRNGFLSLQKDYALLKRVTQSNGYVKEVTVHMIRSPKPAVVFSLISLRRSFPFEVSNQPIGC